MVSCSQQGTTNKRLQQETIKKNNENDIPVAYSEPT